ncbi:MAG: glycosyltransferase family 39 protein [Patescibacteria group bacterium]
MINFEKKKNIILIFLLLSAFQFIYSFIFPSYDITSNYWKTIEEFGSYKSYSYDSFDNSIAAKIYPLVSNYHINSDSAAQILLAHDFPKQYFEGNHTFLNRPLYAFLVFLISRPLHLISDSYSLTFAAGALLNFALFLSAVILFYSLVRKIISNRVAFLSSVLLIFSPFTRVWLTQPETDIFGVFVVALTLYLLYDYMNNPNFKKLAIFSLLIGTLMLGKMLFAMPFFILLSAVFFKKYKEGFLFVLAFSLPLVLWYIIVTKVFGFNYYSKEMTDFDMYLINGWFWNIFKSPWPETFKIFLNAIPSFIFSLVYGFLLLPIILAMVGFKNVIFNRKNFFSVAFVFSFFILFFVMNYYTPRHGFLLFPIIYPSAILGTERIARFLGKFVRVGSNDSRSVLIKKYYPIVICFAIYLILIIISNLNIFEVFKYDGGYPWLP